jgi:hypothetical protein
MKFAAATWFHRKFAAKSDGPLMSAGLKYMNRDPNETQKLLERARGGDPSAFEQLFRRHRGRLQKAMAMRIDRRLAARGLTLPMFFRKPAWKPSAGCPNTCARKKCLSISGFIGLLERRCWHCIAVT